MHCRLVVRAEDARSSGNNLLSSADDHHRSDSGDDASHASSVSSFATATVVVTVQDVNDNPPRFPDAPYSCRVRENASPEVLSAPVFVAGAVDRDDPPFERIEYSLRDTLGGLFSVNASTGEVFASRSLDRETSGSFRLSLIARDVGRPRMTAEAALDVTVDDENDSAPEFEEGLYRLEVPEDAAAGDLVGKVVARDADKGPNAVIR